MAEDKKNPLILVFSPREKLRNIISAGLTQSNFQVVEATSSYIAGVKANQYLPNLIIADITKNNIKDFLFLTRLERSIRTQNISVLISVTTEVHKALEMIRQEVGPKDEQNQDKRIHIIEYPYNFNELLKRIQNILTAYGKTNEQNNENDTTSTKLFGEQLLQKTFTVEQKLHLINSNIGKQWAFPFTIVRSLELLSSDKSCCGQLARCVESDVAATTALLSMANKIHLTGRYNRINSVNDAVVRIGFNETRNILAGLALIDISSEIYIQYGFRRSEFWMHSLTTAIIAEKLCEDVQIDRPELGFIAGLIHDIGKIPIDNLFTDIFIKLLEQTTSKITSFHLIEKELMSFSHADLGHFFATNWSFPNTVNLAILNHHDPDKILSTKTHSFRIFEEAVYVANILAKALCIGHSCDEVLPGIAPAILKDLKIPQGPSELFIKTVFTRMQQYYEYLKITTKDVSFQQTEQNSKNITIYVVNGEKNVFHPIILGLRYNGYPVKTCAQTPEDSVEKNSVTIYIPDEKGPLDVTITADDDEEGTKKFTNLQLFLLDRVCIQESKKDFTKSNIVLLDSNKVDLRLVIQIIEDFYYATSM